MPKAGTGFPASCAVGGLRSPQPSMPPGGSMAGCGITHAARLLRSPCRADVCTPPPPPCPACLPAAVHGLPEGRPHHPALAGAAADQCGPPPGRCCAGHRRRRAHAARADPAPSLAAGRACMGASPACPVPPAGPLTGGRAGGPPTTGEAAAAQRETMTSFDAAARSTLLSALASCPPPCTPGAAPGVGPCSPARMLVYHLCPPCLSCPLPLFSFALLPCCRCCVLAAAMPTQIRSTEALEKQKGHRGKGGGGVNGKGIPWCERQGGVLMHGLTRMPPRKALAAPTLRRLPAGPAAAHLQPVPQQPHPQPPLAPCGTAAVGRRWRWRRRQRHSQRRRSH